MSVCSTLLHTPTGLQWRDSPYIVFVENASKSRYQLDYCLIPTDLNVLSVMHEIGVHDEVSGSEKILYIIVAFVRLYSMAHIVFHIWKHMILTPPTVTTGYSSLRKTMYSTLYRNKLVFGPETSLGRTLGGYGAG